MAKKTEDPPLRMVTLTLPESDAKEAIRFICEIACAVDYAACLDAFRPNSIAAIESLKAAYQKRETP